MVTFRLRPAELEDAPAIASLMTTEEDVRQVAPQEEFPVRAETVERWHRDRLSGHVLEGASRIVAYGEINPDPHHSHRCWIGHVVVDAEVRDRGVGQHVVASLTAIAGRTRRMREVWISAFADNPAALSCYRACGFEEVQRREMIGRELVDLVYRVPSPQRLMSRPYAAFFGACAAGLTLALLPSEARFWILDTLVTSPAAFVALASFLVMLLAVLWQPLLPDQASARSGLVFRPVAYGVAVGVCASVLVALAAHTLGSESVEGSELSHDLLAAIRGGISIGAGWGLALLVFAAFRHRLRTARDEGTSQPGSR